MDCLGRLLLPHQMVKDDVYIDSISPLLDDAASTEAVMEILQIGIATLDRLVGGDWLDADEALQIAALDKMEVAPFFTTVLNNFFPTFYHHPAVWKLIGYPGPSIGFGGYLRRGFDDIDWLPDDDEPDL